MTTAHPTVTEPTTGSTATLRRYLNQLGHEWQLTATEIEQLLRLPRGTWNGPTPAFDEETTLRAQALLQLYSDLTILYGDTLARNWIRGLDQLTGQTRLNRLVESSTEDIRGCCTHAT